MWNIKTIFQLNGITYYDAIRTAPCTYNAYKNKEFSELYIHNAALSYISIYMKDHDLEGKPNIVEIQFFESIS